MWQINWLIKSSNFLCPQFKFEWVCLLRRCSILCLIVHFTMPLIIITTFLKHMMFHMFNAYWFWTARGENEHERAYPFLIQSSVFTIYFSLLRACHVKLLFSDSLISPTVVSHLISPLYVCISLTRVAMLIGVHKFDWPSCIIGDDSTHAMFPGQ